MTDEAYVSAYRKLASEYDMNQTSMSEFLSAVQKLQEQYLKGRTGSAALPVVP